MSDLTVSGHTLARLHRAQKLQIKRAFGELAEGNTAYDENNENTGNEAHMLAANLRYPRRGRPRPWCCPQVYPRRGTRGEGRFMRRRGEIDAPDAVWAADDAVSDMLSYLHALRLTAYLGDKPAQGGAGAAVRRRLL